MASPAGIGSAKRSTTVSLAGASRCSTGVRSRPPAETATASSSSSAACRTSSSVGLDTPSVIRIRPAKRRAAGSTTTSAS